MAIRTKNIPHWADSKAERSTEVKGRRKAKSRKYRKGTFEDLSSLEKDDLLKTVAIKLDLIKPS